MNGNQAMNASRPTPAIKCAGYARVSTLLGQDPENQLSPIRIFAQARNFNLVTELVDLGVSGSRERRPALDQIILGAKKGQYHVIVVSALDRIARNTRMLLNLIFELEGYGCSLISLRENLDFTTPIGRATLTIFGAIAELERELTRERIRVALATKKLAAAKSGSGWRMGRPLVATPDMISKVLTFRSQGLSVRDIERALDKKISHSRIAQIIRDNVPINSDCATNLKNSGPDQPLISTTYESQNEAFHV